jgi:threonine synthase
MPRLHAVQTQGVHPLKRAYDRVMARLANLTTEALNADVAMSYARSHRSEFMWPWETEPASVAGGILDDETYDWAAVVEGMLRSGGSPVVVSEAELDDAARLARGTTPIDVDPTGTAGLAGYVRCVRKDPAIGRERSVVIFSGRCRSQMA